MAEPTGFWTPGLPVTLERLQAALFQKGAPDDFPDLEDLANVAGLDPITNRLWIRNSDGTVTYVTPPVDAAADVGSLRTLGNGSQQAKAGDHGHDVSEINGVGPDIEDGAANVASLRTLGSGAQQAAAGTHNHSFATNVHIARFDSSQEWTIPADTILIWAFAVSGGAGGLGGLWDRPEGGYYAGGNAGGGGAIGISGTPVLVDFDNNDVLSLDIVVGAGADGLESVSGGAVRASAGGTSIVSIHGTVNPLGSSDTTDYLVYLTGGTGGHRVQLDSLFPTAPYPTTSGAAIGRGKGGEGLTAQNSPNRFFYKGIDQFFAEGGDGATILETGWSGGVDNSGTAYGLVGAGGGGGAATMAGASPPAGGLGIDGSDHRFRFTNILPSVRGGSGGDHDPPTAGGDGGFPGSGGGGGAMAVNTAGGDGANGVVIIFYVTADGG